MAICVTQLFIKTYEPEIIHLDEQPPFSINIYTPMLATPIPRIYRTKKRHIKTHLFKMELPQNVSTESKLFTDYRFYNIDGTPHKRLQERAWTDENGLRRFNNDYIVAMGSFYSTSIGDRFKVFLDTGKSFTVIFGDGKWDADCDERHMYTPIVNYDGEVVANLLEFIIDSDVLDPDVYEYGSLERMNNFKGDIEAIYYLGRDDSADWDTYY